MVQRLVRLGTHTPRKQSPYQGAASSFSSTVQANATRFIANGVSLRGWIDADNRRNCLLYERGDLVSIHGVSLL
jgi:hypothetical protein